MRLEDLAGSLDVRPGQAASLIKAWFNPDQIIVISGKKVVAPTKGNAKVMSQSVTALDAIQSLDEEVLRSLCFEPEPMDLYINVGSPRTYLETMYKRVTNTDLDYVIGVIGDFDVKDNSFASTEQIYEYLASLELEPTITVESGSGGVHAWWKFDTSAYGAVRPEFGREIAHRWWSYLNAMAANYGAQVDQLYDTARMMRLPGSIHWPRNGNGTPSKVTLTKHDGPSHSPLRMMEVSSDAWSGRLVKVAKTRESDKQMRVAAEEYASMLSGDKWSQLMAIAGVEDYFQEKVPWQNILEPAGWTYTRTDSVGRDEWARPGREGEKSACVNWEESPHVMSLLSTSHDTNLLDLLDAEIPLTKWRVSLRLNFKDDYQAMVRWTLELMKSEGK